MKKRIVFFALAVLLLFSLLLGGCSASKNVAADEAASESYDTGTADSSAYGGTEESAEAYVDYDAMEPTAAAAEDSAGTDAQTGDAVTDTQTVDLSEKIIYSASAEMETMDYDKTVDKIYELLDRYGAFIESSYVTGVNYSSYSYGYAVTRTAEFVIRVPVESFAGMKESLSEAGNVTYLRTWSDNITTQYYDTQSRLEAYETEEENLTKMLLLCETVEDMITVEDRLSEVQYQIDSLRSQLQNWQNDVDYSTITLDISEVAELTVEEPVVKTYWERLSGAFMNTLVWLADFFKQLFIVVICAIPVLILPVIIAVIVIRVLRKKRRSAGMKPPKRSRREKKAAKAAARNAKKSGNGPPNASPPDGDPGDR